MTNTLKRYTGKTLALSQDELDLLEVLSVWRGRKTGSIARALYYKGVQAFLKDRYLAEDRNEQKEIEMKTHKALEAYIKANSDLAPALRLIRNRPTEDEIEEKRQKRA